MVWNAQVAERMKHSRDRPPKQEQNFVSGTSAANATVMIRQELSISAYICYLFLHSFPIWRPTLSCSDSTAVLVRGVMRCVLWQRKLRPHSGTLFFLHLSLTLTVNKPLNADCSKSPFVFCSFRQRNTICVYAAVTTKTASSAHSPSQF